MSGGIIYCTVLCYTLVTWVGQGSVFLFSFLNSGYWLASK
jgi:hypothetical protein